MHREIAERVQRESARERETERKKEGGGGGEWEKERYDKWATPYTNADAGSKRIRGRRVEAGRRCKNGAERQGERCLRRQHPLHLIISVQNTTVVLRC